MPEGLITEEGPMGDGRFRGDNRNDPIHDSITSDPGIKAVLEQRRPVQDEAMQDAVCDAIQNIDQRKLCGWVAVAIWDNGDGSTSHTVIGDGHSSGLELKGFLHDGIWEAAHSTL